MPESPDPPESFPGAAKDEPAGRVLSVWASGQHTEPAILRAHGYLPTTVHDRDRIPPGIAAAAIAAYTRPGAIVCDPDCGAGTVLVEALWAGRPAVGRPATRRWRRTARGNVAVAQRAGAHTQGTVLDTDPRVLSTARIASIAGQVTLVLTSLRRTRHQASSGPQSTVNAGLARMAHLLGRCVPLLRSNGYAIITVPPTRTRDGALIDVSGALLAITRVAGLIPVSRCVALTAGLRGNRLITRTSFAERRAAAHGRGAGWPTRLSAHYDVWIFQPAQPAAALVAQSVPRSRLPLHLISTSPDVPAVAGDREDAAA